MPRTAQALAKTLQDAQAASEAALDARETTRLRALSLDKKYEELQEQALEALRGGDDDTARDNLREKAQVETQRSNAVGDFKTARDRCERIDADMALRGELSSRAAKPVSARARLARSCEVPAHHWLARLDRAQPHGAGLVANHGGLYCLARRGCCLGGLGLRRHLVRLGLGRIILLLPG